MPADVPVASLECAKRQPARHGEAPRRLATPSAPSSWDAIGNSTQRLTGLDANRPAPWTDTTSMRRPDAAGRATAINFNEFGKTCGRTAVLVFKAARGPKLCTGFASQERGSVEAKACPNVEAGPRAAEYSRLQTAIRCIVDCGDNQNGEVVSGARTCKPLPPKPQENTASCAIFGCAREANNPAQFRHVASHQSVPVQS